MVTRGLNVGLAVFWALSMVACRKQTAPVAVEAGQYGQGTGYTASCNGDFPSWISADPPVADATGETCSDPMDWFRNIPSGTAFGRGLACPVATATTGLVALDYSLQIQEGIEAVFGYDNTNPCFGVVLPQIRVSPRPGPRPTPEQFHFRGIPPAPTLVKLEKEKHARAIGPTPPDSLAR